MDPAALPTTLSKPSRVRYGVLLFACSVSMIIYVDRVCFGTLAGEIRGEFGLSDQQMGWLFFAFAFAYAAFEIPGGWLGDRFGARRTLIPLVLGWSAFTALTGAVFPSARWPGLVFSALFLARFLFGMSEAGAYPSIARAFQSWFPLEERGFAKGAVWMAGRFGGGITPLLVFALLYDNGGTGADKTTHWRHILWIFGSLGIIWCILFWWWYRDRPEQKAGVNQAELALIKAAPPSARLRVPWARLIRNRNLWVLCLMYFMSSYGWYFNISFLKEYLAKYHGVTYAEKWSWDFWRASLMNGMPLLLGSLACLVGGVLSDLFIRGTGNRTWGRRLFGVVGMGSGSLCFFAAMLINGGWWHADSAWAIVWAVSLASFCNDLTMGAAWASCLDIGGKYAGIVSGCMNSLGNLGGAVAMLVTAWVIGMFTAGLAADTSAYWQAARPGWSVNFLIFGGVYVLGAILWFFFDASKRVDE